MGGSRNDANHAVSLNGLSPKESSWTVHPLHDESPTDESLTHRPRDALSKRVAPSDNFFVRGHTSRGRMGTGQ
jgi:hypothetical protein